MVVLFRQKPRTKHHRTPFLAKAKGVRGVRGFGRFGQTQAQGDWMASWGDLCPFGPTKTFVNTHWRAFGGVFYRPENNRTLVNGEWDAMY